MILVIGTLADEIIELICARALAMGVRYQLLDLARYPHAYTVDVTWRDGAPHGSIEGPGWHLPLSALTGVFMRSPPTWLQPLPELPDATRGAAAAECWAGLDALLQTLPCPVANRRAGGFANPSQPFQALKILEAGLKVPPTLVTNQPAAVRRFVAAHPEGVIFKSLGATRSVVRALTAADDARLALLANGPAQFQARIPGDDIRVHVVGGEVFAARIRSQATDYRSAHRLGHEAQMTSARLSADVAARCRALARAHDLVIAGIDLMQTPDGEIYCFEVNPMPGFSGYERGTGHPISRAVVAHLSGRVGRPTPRRQQCPPPTDRRSSSRRIDSPWGSPSTGPSPS